MKDIMGHYTLEVIGACAFGIKADALKDENSHFIQVCLKHNSNTINLYCTHDLLGNK